MKNSHSEPPEAACYWERRNKTKHLTLNSIRPNFVKKNSMPNSIKSLAYIKCYSPSSPRPVKCLSILSDTTVRTSAVDWEDLKPYWKSEKGPHFFSWSIILLFTRFSLPQKIFKNKTNSVAFFSSGHFSNILKYRDHPWDLRTIRNTRRF